GDAVLRAQRMCQQPRRARIGPGAQFGPAGRHRVEVASEQRLRRARRGQLRVAGLRLARAQGRRGGERVGTAAGVGIQRERRRRRVPAPLAQAEQDHALEDVAVVAGVDGVAVIHDASLRDHDRGHGRRVAPAPMLGGRTLSPAMSGDTLKRILLAACMSLAAGATLAQPAEPVDLDMVSRIRQEAFHRSQVMQTLAELTEDFGPRLTNSPAMDRANAWARRKMEGWGLQNVHDDAFADFGRGWEFGSAGIEMLAPRQLPLYALPKGWTAGTDGVVEGEAIALKLEKEADLDKHRGKLRGKVLFVDDLRKYKPGEEPDFHRHDGTSLEDLQAFTVPGDRDDSERARRMKQYLERVEFGRKLNAFLAEEGVLATVELSSRDNGIIRTGGGGSRKAGEPVGVPEFAMIAEHYNQVMRALDDGETVRLRLHSDARFTTDADREGYNTIAEIPGRGALANEVVMIGAHMDSWHTATGAADNGAGVAVMMEAMRILKAVGAKPRRTIRIALWSGEEQGLIG